MPATFLWYDLETWGICPRRSRIAQFAAQRTDLELNPLGEPIVLWAAPALDLLPSPEAALVTGLDPFDLAARGQCEAECLARIHAELREAGTCSVGWNTLRFDDEFIRFGLYRNFFDPYEREWADGNSRWDLLDFARLLHALRPDGIEWPRNEDGTPSFRLEQLAAANGIVHRAAHDASSDVEATLGLARLLRAQQPRLWDYHLEFRSKQRARGLLDPARGEPILHVTSRFPGRRSGAGIVLPLAEHPLSPNQIIVCELHAAPEPLLELAPEAIAERVFSRAEDLPADQPRISLKTVHLNRCPALVELRHVRAAELDRLELDRTRCLEHAAQLRQCPDLAERVRRAFVRAAVPDVDPDQALYAALPDRRDQARRLAVRRARPEQLAALAEGWHDPRSAELLFRYRARNWPQTLDTNESARWRAYRERRLGEAGPLSEYDFANYAAALVRLRETAQTSQHALLDQLQRWGEWLASYP